MSGGADGGGWPSGERNERHAGAVGAMSDAALEHAIETAESARRSAEHLANVLPEPEGGADVDTALGEAADAENRLGGLVRRLRSAKRARENRSLEEYAGGGGG